MKKFLILLISIWAVSTSFANIDEHRAAPTISNGFQYFSEVKTVFPIFLGAGLGVSFQEHFVFNVIYGLTPKPYYETIGSTASSLGGNTAYKKVIESAFQNNSLWRVGFHYNFSDIKKGWQMGLAYSSLSSSGHAGIDSVLAAATGLDYTQLKNALVIAGKSTLIDIKSSLKIGEIHGGYAWEISPNTNLTATLGIAKVLDSNVKLKTGLTNFEATNAGKTLIVKSETELESIINEYGVTPILGLSFSYLF